MVRIDTFDPTRQPQQLIFMALHRLGPNRANLVCLPPNNMVHIDTSGPTRWPQKPIFMALRRLGPNCADLVCHST